MNFTILYCAVYLCLILQVNPWRTKKLFHCPLSSACLLLKSYCVLSFSVINDTKKYTVNRHIHCLMQRSLTGKYCAAHLRLAL